MPSLLHFPLLLLLSLPLIVAAVQIGPESRNNEVIDERQQQEMSKNGRGVMPKRKVPTIADEKGTIERLDDDGSEAAVGWREDSSPRLAPMAIAPSRAVGGGGGLITNMEQRRGPVVKRTTTGRRMEMAEDEDEMEGIGTAIFAPMEAPSRIRGAGKKSSSIVVPTSTTKMVSMAAEWIGTPPSNADGTPRPLLVRLPIKKLQRPRWKDGGQRVNFAAKQPLLYSLNEDDRLSILPSPNADANGRPPSIDIGTPSSPIIGISSSLSAPPKFAKKPLSKSGPRLGKYAKIAGMSAKGKIAMVQPKTAVTTTPQNVPSPPPTPPPIDPLQMTFGNCQKMKSFSTLFGVADPRAWVRTNCFLLQLYVRASCDELLRFVTSCSKWAEATPKK